MYRKWVARSCRLRGQDERDNQAVQPEHLSKDQDQNHADEESRLLRGPSNSCIADHTDGKASSQSGQADTQSSAKLQERPASNINSIYRLPQIKAAHL